MTNALSCLFLCSFLREFEKYFSLRELVQEMQEAHPEMYPAPLSLSLSLSDLSLFYYLYRVLQFMCSCIPVLSLLGSISLTLSFSPLLLLNPFLFSPAANLDYILTALGYIANESSDAGTSSFGTSKATPTGSALDEGVIQSLVSQVKEVLSHLGEGFIKVSGCGHNICKLL